MYGSERIDLTGDGRVFYVPYLPDRSPELPFGGRRPSVLVLPGGGLACLSAREGESVALAFAARGFNAFVLHYSLNEHASWPHPLADAMRAMRSIRAHAAEWSLDPDAIAVCGFSAGGHIAASLAVYWNDPGLCAAAGVLPDEAKPNAVILNYPVMSPREQADSGTLDRLRRGHEGDPSIDDTLAVELHVGRHTPPCFIMHAYFDNGAPIAGSMVFAMALLRNGIPFELHVPQDGAHGLALADASTYAGGWTLNRDYARWPDLASAWMRKLFGYFPSEPEAVYPSALERMGR